MRVESSSSQKAIPFDYEHGLVIFRGTGPDGIPLRIELDTCTSPNVVRYPLAAEHRWLTGKIVDSRGILQSSESDADEAEVPEFSLSGLHVQNLFALTDPLGGPASPDLMLGERFLQEVVVAVDFPHREATFELSSDWKGPSADTALVVCDIDTSYGGIPCVHDEITIDGGVTVSSAYLDTGFNDGILLSPSLADRVGLTKDAPGVEQVGGGGYGGPVTVLKGRIEEVAIGSVRLRGISAYRPPEGSEAPFPDPNWANIGNKVFENFIATWALKAGVFQLHSHR